MLRLSHCQASIIEAVGLRRACLERELILLPFRRQAGDGSGRNGFSALIAHKAHSHRADVTRAGLGIERTFVFSRGTNGHTPIPDIEYSRRALSAGLLDVEAKAAFEGVAGTGLFVDLHRSEESRVGDEVQIGRASC